MRAAIIYNPVSGREKGSRIAMLLANKIRDDFDKIEIVKTSSREDAVRFAKDYTDLGVHSIFAVGGDGTVGDVIRGISESSNENKPILGAIPGGTLNGISRMLGFPIQIVRAIRALDLNQTEYIDYALCNDTPFMMIYSIGDIPESIHNTDSSSKANFAILAYFANIAKHSFKNSKHSLTVNIDGEIITGKYNHVGVITSNALDRFTPPTIEINKNDGKLHVFLIEESNFLDKMILVPDLVLGNLEYNENLIYRTAESISITSDSTDITTDLDGDRFDPVPSNIHIIPQGINMYVLK